MIAAAYQSAVLVSTLPISTASQCNVHGSSYANLESHKAVSCCACQCLTVSAVNKSKVKEQVRDRRLPRAFLEYLWRWLSIFEI